MNALQHPYAQIIEDAERAMLPLEQLAIETFHRFGPGIYIREVRMPAGAFVIGHHHKTEHLNIMLTGRLRLVTSDGDTQELVAPYMYVAPPGRKAAVILEDVVWLNVHATTETDIERLEDALLVKSEAWHEAQHKQLESA